VRALDAFEGPPAPPNGPTGNRHHIAHIQGRAPERHPRASGSSVLPRNMQALWAVDDAQMRAFERALPRRGSATSGKVPVRGAAGGTARRSRRAATGRFSTPDPLSGGARRGQPDRPRCAARNAALPAATRRSRSATRLAAYNGRLGAGVRGRNAWTGSLEVGRRGRSGGAGPRCVRRAAGRDRRGARAVLTVAAGRNRLRKPDPFRNAEGPSKTGFDR